jgi:polyisoprenoid-binding protein YceI
MGRVGPAVGALDRAGTSGHRVLPPDGAAEGSCELHVQGVDFFDSANHPTMTFATTAITGSGATWSFEGPLTVKGRTSPVRLDASLTGKALFSVDEKEHIGFVARGALSRAAFGVAPAIPSFVLSDEVQLDLSVQLVAE